MGKLAGIIIAVVFIVIMVFVYLKVGTKGATEAKIYVDTTAANIQKAQQSMDEMNKSIEETKKAADRMMGR